MPEMLSRRAITALKAAAESLAITLREIGVAIGIVAVDVWVFVIVEIRSRRLNAIMPAMARNFIELARGYIPAAFLHITRIS